MLNGCGVGGAQLWTIRNGSSCAINTLRGHMRTFFNNSMLKFVQKSQIERFLPNVIFRDIMILPCS